MPFASCEWFGSNDKTSCFSPHYQFFRWFELRGWFWAFLSFCCVAFSCCIAALRSCSALSLLIFSSCCFCFCWSLLFSFLFFSLSCLLFLLFLSCCFFCCCCCFGWFLICFMHKARLYRVSSSFGLLRRDYLYAFAASLNIFFCWHITPILWKACARRLRSCCSFALFSNAFTAAESFCCAMRAHPRL